ncbi:uncharacterized protein LOC131849558 isoform X2 [Achroia grisella]|uniref:uncharacterized protein LOC131849558 isoform X2 n=1 Tax=Achroia grisella TaxID=688607 RepID=UPI0027D33341|nr:uncharacterized protein LOC131849558 isoform X2 [Achroia grisella]
MARWCVGAILLTLVVCASAADTQSRFPDLQSARQADADEMVSNLLQWIQGLYQQKNRKARQYFGGKPEKPRPFEPASYLPPTGYPPSGSRPTPAYNEGPPPTSPPYTSPGYPSNQPSQPDQPYSPSQPSYKPSQPTQPAYQPSQSTQSPYQPSQPSSPSYQPSQPEYQPGLPTYNPNQPSYQTPNQPPNQPTYQPPSQPTYQPPSQPTYQPPSQPTYQPPSQPSYQTPSQPTYRPPSQSTYQPPNQPTYKPPSQSTYQPPNQPTYQPPSQPTYQPSQPSYQPPQSSYQPSQPTSPPYKPDENTQSPFEVPSQPQRPSRPDIGDGSSSSSTEDDNRHPPHIHAITVDCGKDMMTINIEFNKVYNGIIYSQDHYNQPDCVYVRENSNQIKYSFTVSLNTCGTRFFSDFQNEGQAYLENVLVLQNEPGIQEVWDHIRRVRCLWEGNLTKQLVSSLSVGMLNQITSNFSGDTAMARLDIQIGRGPFAPEANGLVKIGEIMTLVVTVTGDAGFDILVRECVARDSESNHIVPLTDSNGCVLKPKLFGAFQKTRETGNTGASIIAYAFFNAFKFPDEMDLIIQCDVELCKTDCDVCPLPGSIEPRRRRRDIIHVGNSTIEPSTTISKGLRVVFAEDLPSEPTGFCISSSAALWGGVLVLLGSLLSSVMVSLCWMKSRGSNKLS